MNICFCLLRQLIWRIYLEDDGNQREIPKTLDSKQELHFRSQYSSLDYNGNPNSFTFNRRKTKNIGFILIFRFLITRVVILADIGPFMYHSLINHISLKILIVKFELNLEIRSNYSFMWRCFYHNNYRQSNY